MLSKKQTNTIHPMLVSIYGYKKNVQDEDSIVIKDELLYP